MSTFLIANAKELTKRLDACLARIDSKIRVDNAGQIAADATGGWMVLSELRDLGGEYGAFLEDLVKGKMPPNLNVQLKLIKAFCELIETELADDKTAFEV
jgi:hypothetical protein